MESLIGLSIIEQLLASGTIQEDLISSICEKYSIHKEDVLKLQERINVVDPIIA